MVKALTFFTDRPQVDERWCWTVWDFKEEGGDSHGNGHSNVWSLGHAETMGSESGLGSLDPAESLQLHLAHLLCRHLWLLF